MKYEDSVVLDMEVWAWVVAYLLGFALLQWYLYRYFMKGESTTNSSPENATPKFEGGSTAVEVDHGAEPPEDYVACDHCGAHNESHATFTFCKNCGNRL